MCAARRHREVGDGMNGRASGFVVRITVKRRRHARPV
jgi:hypothetical protein